MHAAAPIVLGDSGPALPAAALAQTVPAAAQLMGHPAERGVRPVAHAIHRPVTYPRGRGQNEALVDLARPWVNRGSPAAIDGGWACAGAERRSSGIARGQCRRLAATTGGYCFYMSGAPQSAHAPRTVTQQQKSGPSDRCLSVNRASTAAG